MNARQHSVGRKNLKVIALACLICAFEGVALAPLAGARCAGEDFAQVRIRAVEEHGLSQGTLVLQEGFPALSEDRGTLAVLHEDDVMGESIVLYLIDFLGRFDGPWNLSSRTLIDMSERPRDEAGLNELRQRVAMVNGHLCSRNFRPMDVLYDLRHTFGYRFPTPASWELEWSEWSVKYEYATDTVTVSAGRVAPRSLRVVRPMEVAGVRGGHPDNFCHIKGQPSQAWADERSRLVVFRINNVGGHYCDRPDTWLVERLP